MPNHTPPPQSFSALRAGAAWAADRYLYLRDGWSLTTHLTLLALVIMVPLLVFAGLSLHFHIEAARTGLYQDAQRMADSLTANIDREMTSVMTLLNVLAQDTAFDRREYNALYLRAKEGLRGRKGFVVLFGTDPQPLFSTRFDYGVTLPESSDDGSAAEVVRSARPIISNLFFSRPAQRRVFAAIVPILRDGAVVGRLHLALEPRDLAEAILPSGMEPRWGFSIVDRNFIYVLSSDPRAYPTGQPVQRSIVDQVHADRGQFRAATDDGETLLTAHRKSSLFGWTAFVTSPVALVEQPLGEVWRKFAFIGLGAFTLSLLAAYAVSRAMARPIQQLSGAAFAFGEGNDVPCLHSLLREANLLSSAFASAARQLRGRTAALAESERRFRLFAEQTHDVIWFIDPDKRSIDYVSPAFASIFGTGEAPASMTTWRGAVHQSDLAAFDELFAGPLKDSAQHEYRIQRPDGAIRWVRDTRFPLDASEGKPRIIAGILSDITQRKAAVDALRAAEADAQTRAQELENLYRSAPIGLALMDDACRLLRLNDFLAAMSGKPREAIRDRSFFEVFPKLEEHVRPFCEAVLSTGIPARNIELELDGESAAGPQYLLAHFYPVKVRDGAVSGIGAIIEDITERKRTEQDLARLAAIVYAASDAMFSFAPTGRIQNWNPAAQSLFQYADTEAVERSFSMLFPEDDEQGYQALRQAWERDESLRLNTRMRRKDGSVFEASVSIAAIKEGGRTTAISTTIEDISERRRSEQRQLLMNRELSHRVKNTLAVIQAMARHTLRSSPDPATFSLAFEGRLRALAIAHSLLTASEWEGAEIGDLAREQLGAHISAAGQLRLDGPKLLLPPGMATSLGLVLHELGANAAQHGALSTPSGTVTLKWQIVPAAPHKTLKIEWTERGGPAVGKPARRGFGSVLIENSGKVQQHFDPEGFRCVIEMPLMEPAAKAF